MVITRFVIEWFADINCIIFTVAKTRFTAPLTRRGKTKFATIKWYNLCQQIIQSQTCYPLIVMHIIVNSSVFNILFATNKSISGCVFSRIKCIGIIVVVTSKSAF